MSDSPDLAPARKLRELRHARGKSLAVVAELAGISRSHLSRLEHGERALDRRSLIVALANALDVAPTEITAAALDAPRVAEDDHALSAVRTALLGVSMGEPGGDVVTLDALRERTHRVTAALNDARPTAAGAALPALIADAHTTLAVGRHDGELLRLLTLLHMQGTQAWLATVGAPTDLGWLAATMARDAAERLAEPVPLGVAAYGTSLALLSAGAHDLAAATLTRTHLPKSTDDGLTVAGSLALVSSLIAASRGQQSERFAALDHAAELAARTGETDRLAFAFGPANVGVWRIQGSLETGEYADAAATAETIDPRGLPDRDRQAVYWREFGRALAHLPRQQDRAVSALRTAEQLSPEHVHRHPFTRSTLAEMVSRAKRDAVGRELRGMAYRAGLHV